MREEAVQLAGAPALLCFPHIAALVSSDLLTLLLKFVLEATAIHVRARDAGIHPEADDDAILCVVAGGILRVFGCICNSAEELRALRPADVTVQISIHKTKFGRDAMDSHMPSILRSAYPPQKSFLLLHKPVALENNLLKASRRNAPQHVRSHSFTDLPADPLDVIVQADHIGPCGEELHDEVPAFLISDDRHLDAHVCPFSTDQGLSVVSQLLLVCHKESYAMLGDALSRQ
mmetsp:Transcript_14805/g.23477  ORF Transcript_14805/g.23477 Transcript_14805/m.23477 type:complete len:232 (-) Transcript_14805:576-1271(-)